MHSNVYEGLEKMKRSGSEEIPVDTSWRVFNSLQKRYSAHLRNRLRQRLTPSYEEFLKEIEEEEKDNELRNSSSLTENESYNNDNELNSIPSSNNSDNDEDEWISVNSSSNNEDDLDSNSEYDKNVNSKNKKGSSGESSDGDDEALDDFIKKLTLDLEELDATEEGNCDKFHYTSLTDYLRKASIVEDGNLRDTEKEEKDLQQGILKLSAQERLPLVQALDAIADINKVLKAGKLTSRMERIIEYKQDHPFLDGYDEDELGCCPWLVYKVEKMIDRFFASQWPN